MGPYARPKEYYEDIYDQVTVDVGRDNTEMFGKMYDDFFKIMPNEPKNSPRAVIHLNLIYMVFVGNSLLDRYDKREDRVREMMASDEAKDTQIENARLMTEPVCEHCDSTGLRITSKMLHYRMSFDDPEEVLFMLRCTQCKKNMAMWSDGKVLEHRKTHCPKCQAVMSEKGGRKGKILTTAYKCPECKYAYVDKLDLNIKEKAKPDPNFQKDRELFCLHDEKVREELRNAKWRYEEMARFGKEWQEKEDNKHIYDAIAEIKKPKIAELTPMLEPTLEVAGYVEFSLSKPELGKDVYVGFSCLDSKPDREDYDSRKSLQKTIRGALKDTNWRLMSEGISYRLGYLSGRLRAFEREDDLKKLLQKEGWTKPKKTSSGEGKMNAYRIKGKNGEDIIL